MHPHIMRLYEVIDTPTDILLFVEYVPKGEIFEYIVEQGRVSSALLADIQTHHLISRQCLI